MLFTVLPNFFLLNTCWMATTNFCTCWRHPKKSHACWVLIFFCACWSSTNEFKCVFVPADITKTVDVQVCTCWIIFIYICTCWNPLCLHCLLRCVIFRISPVEEQELLSWSSPSSSLCSSAPNNRSKSSSFILFVGYLCFICFVLFIVWLVDTRLNGKYLSAGVFEKMFYSTGVYEEIQRNVWLNRYLIGL